MEYKPVLGDDELLELWAETPSSRKLARLTGIAESTLRTRIRKLMANAPILPDPDRHGKIEQLAASIPLDSPGGGTIKEALVTLYGSAAYNRETNEWVKEGLNSVKARYTYPQAKATWPPIQPYYEVAVSTYAPIPRMETSLQRVFIWGDMQCGFWRESGRLVPFHDEAAIDAQFQMLALYQPHKVIIIGDFLDFPELGKYRKEPAFAFTLNPSIAYATEVLAKIRAIVGEQCEIIFVPGNHEARLVSAIVDNLAALYGLRRVGDLFPVLSIPFLLQFEKFKIHCEEQYPAGQVWLTDDLVCTHAPDKRLRATQICGHLVRATVDSETFHYRDGAKTYKTYIVPGTGNYGGKPADKFRLCRTNIPSNVGRSNAEQACATIEISKDGSRHHVSVWPIIDGGSFFKDTFVQGVAQPFEYLESAA